MIYSDGKRALVPFARRYERVTIGDETYLIGTLSIGERERWVRWVNDTSESPELKGIARRDLQACRLIQHMAVADVQGVPLYPMDDATTLALYNGDYTIVRGLMVACDKLLAGQISEAEKAAGN